jgi:hypothetical protein
MMEGLLKDNKKPIDDKSYPQFNDKHPKLLNQVQNKIRCKHYIYTHVLNRGGKGVTSPGDILFE